MTTETDFSGKPYYDDFDPAKHFHRVLSQPRRRVQARELTQSQTILQDQIEKFGRHIFTDGSVVEKCQLTFEPALAYVKVSDNYSNGYPLTPSDLEGKFVQADNGLRALVNKGLSGSVSQTPNLNTLYVDYLNSASDGTTRFFTEGQILSVYDSANVAVGSVTTANAAVSGNSSVTGLAYRVGISDGVIFQKGFFIGVEPQQLIVTRYHNTPDGISVGFHTEELIVNSDEDESLLDNSRGSPNYGAPGADRLKLRPILVARDTANTFDSNVETFFSVVDFVEGTPARVATDASYAALGRELARRTFEESGDYVVEPFSPTLLDISGNVTHLKLELDPGLAYIGGYRVETVGKIVSHVRKGTDVKQAVGQVSTLTMGNYVYATELAGKFDFPAVGVVSLRSSTAQAVTTALADGASINSLAAPGSEIGTARVVGIEYDDGVPGTSSATYRLYLFDVQMSSGHSFTEVRSIYAISASEKGFADLVLESGSAAIKDSSLTPLVYRLGVNAAKTLRSEANAVVAEFDYRAAANVTFANTGVATLTVPSYTGGTSRFTYGVGTLSSVSERDFIVTVTSNAMSANLAGRASNTDANTLGWALGYEADFSTQYEVGDHVAVLNSTVQEVRLVTAVNSSSLSFSNALTYSWSNADHALFYPVGYQLPISDRSEQSIAVSSNTSATIDLGRAFTAPFDATVYFDVRRTSASPAKKFLYKKAYVCIDTDTHPANTVGPWSLGVPDVLFVSGVWVGNTYSNTGINSRALFALDSGQRDSLYSLASIEPPTGTTLSGSKILVEFACFRPDVSQGIGYYSVDSYPVDDSGNSSSNTVLTQSIPIYTASADGMFYPLRDCVDFRPYAANTVQLTSNVTTAAASCENPSNTVSISLAAGSFAPKADSSFETDVQYYLGRKDVIGMTNHGSIVIKEGNPSEYPVEPHRISDGVSLNYVHVKPYPSPAATVDVSTIKNRRYTMRDIGGIDDRLKTVEYYTSLSVLEQSTKNLLIQSNTGGDRFKNGIFADPFNGHDLGNVFDPDYCISIDSDASEARPIFTQELINLKYANSEPSGGIYVSSNGKLVLLGCERVDNPYLFQAYATQLRNPSQDIAYRWAGSVYLSPDGDYTPDVTVNPGVSASIDLYSNWKYLADKLNIAMNTDGQGTWSTQYGTWREVSRRSETTTTSSQSSSEPLTVDLYYSSYGRVSFNLPASVLGMAGPGQGGPGAYANSLYYYDPTTGQPVYLTQEEQYQLISSITDGWIPQTVQISYSGSSSTTTTTTTYVDEVRSGVQTEVGANYNTYDLGSYVTDVSLQPFIRAQSVAFAATALKPQTRVWIWFDETNVSDYCAQLDTVSGALGPLGGPFFTNAYGQIEGVFYIPAGTFRTGERKFRILDISDLVTEETILRSSCETTFYGTNLAYAKNNVSLNIKEPQVFNASIPESRTVVSSVTTTSGGSVRTIVPVNCQCYASPCAQSFVMPSESLGTESIPGIYVAAIDLFFERKDPVLGLTVMVREMENGYPSPKIVPYGEKHLNSSDVELSEDATAATTVVFDAPIFLESEKEYCVVIRADGYNPNYAMWTAALGGDPDVATNIPGYKNSFVGNFFTSSTDTGWTAYQQEDVKISIYRLTFTTLDATACFVNDDSEYLDIDSQLGNFLVGETVYFSNGVDFANSASVEEGNAVVGLPANTAFAANDKVYVTSNTEVSSFIANVVSVGSNTITLNVSPGFTDAECEIGHLRANGGLRGSLYSLSSLAGKMRVANSTATSSDYVTANVRVIGSASNAAARVAAVSNIPYNAVMPKLSISVPRQTNMLFSMAGTSNTAVSDSSRISLDFAHDAELRDYERVVLSRSTELASSADKSLKVYARFLSESEKISPAIDMGKCGLHTVHNVVNADDANGTVYESEKGVGGLAINKYISRTVVLADGQDAEDAQLYVAAYKPPGTDIYVYGRFEHYADPTPFSVIPWTPMETSTSIVSSFANENDFVEYTYQLPSINPLDGSAWLNSNNYGIVEYTGYGSEIYEGYKKFAVKIVLLSSDSAVVPRLQDVRFVALQK